MFFQRFLNPAESAVIDTDGAGAIALTSATPGITAVAFTTDGSNGQLTVTIAPRVAGYAVASDAASATAALASAQLGVAAAGSFVIVVSDLAVPGVIDLAAVAVRVNVILR